MGETNLQMNDEDLEQHCQDVVVYCFWDDGDWTEKDYEILSDMMKRFQNTFKN
jgi:hypothetical protein